MRGGREEEGQGSTTSGIRLPCTYNREIKLQLRLEKKEKTKGRGRESRKIGKKKEEGKNEIMIFLKGVEYQGKYLRQLRRTKKNMN